MLFVVQLVVIELNANVPLVVKEQLAIELVITREPSEFVSGVKAAELLPLNPDGGEPSKTLMASLKLILVLIVPDKLPFAPLTLPFVVPANERETVVELVVDHVADTVHATVPLQTGFK